MLLLPLITQASPVTAEIGWHAAGKGGAVAAGRAEAEGSPGALSGTDGLRPALFADGRGRAEHGLCASAF